jgi:hypothetical protein
MKKTLLLSLALLFIANGLIAQKYITKEGEIEIFSETSLFTIEAKNQKVASILNAENGEIVVSTLVRSFKFHEALVGEHFNENYMESHKFPKSVFKGKIINFSSIDLNTDGTHNVTISGNLTLHGETNPVKSEGTVAVKDGKISATTEFIVSLAQHKIKIEKNYKDRIKDEIKLIIHFDYAKYEKR